MYLQRNNKAAIVHRNERNLLRALLQKCNNVANSVLCNYNQVLSNKY
jgi:hypothetical protein